MSEVRDPERDQVAPVPNDNPSCHDLVIEDLLERKQFGLRKYGTILQAGNGRSFIRDAYEEVMDLACYLRGLLEEFETGEAFDFEPEVEDDVESIQLALWEDKA